MKSKIRLVCYLPRRLIKVLEDITPLFEDSGINDPKRGALTRALEAVIQYYMESDEYIKKCDAVARLTLERQRIFEYFSKKERELQETFKKREEKK